jgi:hypothetical protein
MTTLNTSASKVIACFRPFQVCSLGLRSHQGLRPTDVLFELIGAGQMRFTCWSKRAYSHRVVNQISYCGLRLTVDLIKVSRSRLHCDRLLKRIIYLDMQPGAHQKSACSTFSLFTSDPPLCEEGMLHWCWCAKSQNELHVVGQTLISSWQAHSPLSWWRWCSHCLPFLQVLRLSRSTTRCPLVCRICRTLTSLKLGSVSRLGESSPQLGRYAPQL